MQFTVDRGDLIRALKHPLGVVDKRGGMPILAHCLVQADDQGFSLSATDLESSFKGRFPAEVKEPGAFVVQAHALYDLVKSLPKGTLRISGDESQVKVEAGDSVSNLPTMPAEQFPLLPSSQGVTVAPVDAQALLDLIDKTSFSMSGDGLQYSLASTLWERREVDGNSYLRLVTTDGHRLSLAEQAQPGLVCLEWPPKGILVPAKAVREIRRFVEHYSKKGAVDLGLGFVQEEYDEGGVTKIKSKVQTLFLRAGDKELSVRPLDRRFPEYHYIIPARCKHRFTFNRQELAAAVKRASLLSTDRFRRVSISLNNYTFEPRPTAEVACENPDVGAGQEVVEILEKIGGKKGVTTIIFNANYLLEPLAVMNGETVVMEINEANRPVRLIDPSSPGALWVVMPMRL